MKTTLIRRLKYYYPLERMHAFITFPLLFLYSLSTNDTLSILWLLYGLALCIFILIQGQHYWKLKLYSLQGKKFDKRAKLHFFRVARKINLVCIALIPIMAILQLWIYNWTINSENHLLLLFGLAANIFALLEHINYYNRQLMIDKFSDLKYLIHHKKFKVSSLKKDLKEGKI